MLADQPAGVFTVTARLAAKTRRVCSIIYRQIFSVEDFVSVVIRDRHLGGRDQCETAVVLDMKQVILKFWKLVSTKKSVSVDQKWRQRLGVTMLDCVDLEHKIDERAAQPRSRAVQNCKA